MIKKIFFLFFTVFLSSVFILSAQERKTDDQRRKELEDFKKKRVEYISREMNLSEQESKAFWPLADELEEKKFELNRSVRQEMRKMRDTQKEKKSISEKEYERMIDQQADLKIKEAELEKEYFKKFRKVISAEKVFKYQRAEQRFAREMFGNSPGRPAGGSPRNNGGR